VHLDEEEQDTFQGREKAIFSGESFDKGFWVAERSAEWVNPPEEMDDATRKELVQLVKKQATKQNLNLEW
jgi:hypothetical protein